MMNKRLTIFIASPDSYSDVFEVFMQCYKKFFDDNPYELVLATNTRNFDNITIIANNNPGDSWIERVLPALKYIKTKYVLLMVDDFFISRKINYRMIESILDDMDEYNINYCGLSNKLKGKRLKKNSILVRVKKRQAYAINLQMGIFRYDYLIKKLGDGSETGWELEKRWVAETANAPRGYFNDIVSCKKDIIKCLHGVAKGKWFPGVLKILKKNKINVNISREIMSFREELKINTVKKLGKKFSPRNRKLIKNILSKVGYKFITDN